MDEWRAKELVYEDVVDLELKFAKEAMELGPGMDEGGMVARSGKEGGGEMGVAGFQRTWKVGEEVG